MKHPYNVHDISKSTGLNYHLILRLIKNLSKFFYNEIITGDKNEKFFSENARRILGRIAELRQGDIRTTKELKSALENDKVYKTEHKIHETEVQNGANQNTNHIKHTPSDMGFFAQAKEFYELLEIKNAQVLEEKEKRIQEKEQIILYKNKVESLESRLLLLTDGKSVEEMKKEAEEKKDTKNKLFDELHSLDGKWFCSHKRKDIIVKLRELD